MSKHLIMVPVMLVNRLSSANLGPVLRFQPLGLGSGAFDAGGWAWIWAFVITVILIWLASKSV